MIDLTLQSIQQAMKFLPDTATLPHAIHCGQAALLEFEKCLKGNGFKSVYSWSQTDGIPVYRDFTLPDNVIEVLNAKGRVLTRISIEA